MSSTDNKPVVDGDHNDDELLEQKHFQHVIDAFMYYRTSCQLQVDRKKKSLESLTKEHQSTLDFLKVRFEKMIKAIDVNYEFIKNIVLCVDEMFVNSEMRNETTQNISLEPITTDDMDRVRTTIQQCVRDWSIEGETERRQCYEPIITELNNLFPSDVFDHTKISVLVPGAGLGRLMFDIASNGFTCQGNEFSLYMLFASNFILNFCSKAQCVSLFPWVHQTCNLISEEDQLQEIKLPDVSTQELDPDRISMGAGDFLEVYTKSNIWDCVAMSFFLDTAHNVLDYIEKVWSILKPGGYWINFGPLLYHFANVPSQISIELTYEEVKDIILNKYNFILLKEEIGVKASYVQNKKSMLKTEYNCVYFVVQKPLLV